MVFGFQHISVHPHHEFIDNTKRKVIFDDWQLSYLISYNMRLFTPYVGIKLSRGDLIEWIGEERKRRSSEDREALGVVLGLDFNLNKKLWFNLEARFLDEKAVSFSFNFLL